MLCSRKLIDGYVFIEDHLIFFHTKPDVILISMEGKIVRIFNEKVEELVSCEGTRRAVYSTLESFHLHHNVKEMVSKLKQLLCEPKCLPLFGHLRPLVPVKQQIEYDRIQPYRSHERIRSVTLHRQETEGLGFALRGGVQHGLGVYITGVKADSEAHLSGLRVGDEVIRINGYSLRQAVSHEVASFIAQKQYLELTVRNVGMIPEQKAESDNITWQYIEELLSERVFEIDGEKYTTVDVSVIIPIASQFGCSVVCNEESAILVQSIQLGSLAEQLGLEVADQILQVNGIPFTDISHSEAVVALKGSRLLNMTILKKLNSKHLQFDNKPSSPKVTLSKGKARTLAEVKRSRRASHSKEHELKIEATLNDLNKSNGTIKSKDKKDETKYVGIKGTISPDKPVLLNPYEAKSSLSSETSPVYSIPHSRREKQPTSEVIVTSDLAEVDQIYEEPALLIDPSASPNSSTGDKTKTATNSDSRDKEKTDTMIATDNIAMPKTTTRSPLSQDNLRELRKQLVAARKLDNPPKPALHSISRSESIEELDEENLERDSKPDTKPDREPDNQSNVSKSTQLTSVENVENSTKPTVSDKKGEFSRASSGESTSSTLHVDTSSELSEARQRVSPKAPVYPYTSEGKTTSFRIQKPVLLHPTTTSHRRTASMDVTVTDSINEPWRMLTNEQIAGRQTEKVSLDNIDMTSHIGLDLEVTSQYGHEAIIVASIHESSPFHKQGGIHNGDELLMVGGHSLMNTDVTTALNLIKQNIKDNKGSIEILVAKVPPRDQQIEVTYF